jgi:hypothetical protein
VARSVVLCAISPVSVVNSRVRGADGSIKPGASAPGTCHGEIREPTKWATAEALDRDSNFIIVTSSEARGLSPAPRG